MIYNKADDGRVLRSNKRQGWLETAHPGRHHKSYNLKGHHMFRR